MQEMEMETLNYPITTTSISALLYDFIKHQPGNNIAEIEVETGRILTYADLLVKSTSLVAGLMSIGVTSASVLAVLSYNSQESHLFLLAGLFLGAVVVPIDPVCQEDEMQYILKLVEPDFIFSEGGKTLFRLHQILPLITEFPTPRLIVNNNRKGHIKFCELLLEPDPDFVPVLQEPDEDHVVTILFTSGSTGVPKGVLMPETYFLKSSTLMSKIETKETPINYLMATSISWLSGLLRYMMNLISGHRTIYLRGRVHEVVLLETIQRYRINNMVANPTPVLRLALYPRLFDYDFTSLNRVNICGLPVSRKCQLLIESQLSNSVGIYQHYGLTELGIVSSNSPGMSKPGSCGKPLPGIEFKVVDPESGQNLEVDTQGELCFRGDNFMLGYLKNPELTAQVIDKERWFHSGDIGYFDSDGFIYVIERLKEFIRYTNLKISPTEIEYALLNHPKVKEAVAFGIKHPVDGEWPAAVVMVDLHSSVTPEEIADFMEATALPEYYPRGGIYFAHTIPRSSSGKAKRCLVKEKYFPTLLPEPDSKSKTSKKSK